MDAAILVISAADGIQGHTRTLWKLLERHKIPVILFINKMDQPGMEKETVLEQLRAQLSDACIDFSEPESEECMEQIAVSEEELLNFFLENSCLKKEQIISTIQKREAFPCLFGSALKNEGVDRLLEMLFTYIKMPEYPQKFGARVYKIARDEQGNRLTYMKITGGSLKVKEMISSDAEGDGYWE